MSGSAQFVALAKARASDKKRRAEGGNAGVCLRQVRAAFQDVVSAENDFIFGRQTAAQTVIRPQ